MAAGDLLILTGPEVRELLAGRHDEVLAAVRHAYEAHGRGETSVPHSLFLRFPDSERDRIIALPAYLGGDINLAGVKWVASVPGNLERGLPRASAVMVLNDRVTGVPEVLLEGSLISAARTAASAALAAATLASEPPAVAGFVGCGPINLEVGRYLRAVWPGVGRWIVFDLDPARAAGFAERCRAELPGLTVETTTELTRVLAAAPVVSFATNTVEPHLDDLSVCPEGATLLHVSLRDLTPEAILAADNVVDDVGHVCRAQTSVHLAEQRLGDRSFIRASLPEVLAGSAPPKADPRAPTVFSPFGLGILDLALAALVRDRARETGRGTRVPSFLPVDA